MSKENSEVSNDLSWHNIVPAWISSAIRPDKEFGINYKGDGWYNHHEDWMLINKTLTGFHVMVWNGYDPRPFFKKVADAEVRT